MITCRKTCLLQNHLILCCWVIKVHQPHVHSIQINPGLTKQVCLCNNPFDACSIERKVCLSACLAGIFHGACAACGAGVILPCPGISNCRVILFKPCLNGKNSVNANCCVRSCDCNSISAPGIRFVVIPLT